MSKFELEDKVYFKGLPEEIGIVKEIMIQDSKPMYYVNWNGGVASNTWYFEKELESVNG